MTVPQCESEHASNISSEYTMVILFLYTGYGLVNLNSVVEFFLYELTINQFNALIQINPNVIIEDRFVRVMRNNNRVQNQHIPSNCIYPVKLYSYLPLPSFL